MISLISPRRSIRGSVLDYRTPAEYFGGPNLIACWPLTSGYGLMDVVGGNHLTPADVLNGHGDFAIDADPYFTKGTSWTIVGGVASAVDAGVGQRSIGKSGLVVIGKTYKVRYDVVAVSGVGITVALGTTNGTTRTTTGTFVENITVAGSGAANLTIGAGATATIDNWTVEEVYNGNISVDGAYLNGVSNCLQTTRSLDLSAYNKVCLVSDVRIWDYNLTGSEMLFELSVLFTSNAGSFGVLTEGAVAGDPLRFSVFGNVAADTARYLPTLTNIIDKNSRQMAATWDMSLAGNESDYFQDGTRLTPSSRISQNNTGNFGNYPLYIGARAGTSLFSNISVKNVALLAGRTDYDWADYYAWMNDTRSPHFWSMYGIALPEEKISEKSNKPSVVDRSKKYKVHPSPDIPAAVENRIKELSKITVDPSVAVRELVKISAEIQEAINLSSSMVEAYNSASIIHEAEAIAAEARIGPRSMTARRANEQAQAAAFERARKIKAEADRVAAIARQREDQDAYQAMSFIVNNLLD